MTLVALIYLPYLVPTDCCMSTCAYAHAKLSKTTCFLGQIMNPKTTFFLVRWE
jgi:hypothetical protein